MVSERGYGTIDLNKTPRICATRPGLETQEAIPMSTSDSTPNTPTKTCTKCGVEFPATPEYFYKSRDGRYGVRAQCIRCIRKFRADRYKEPRPDSYRPAAGRKYCSGCGFECDTAIAGKYFSRNSHNKDGLRYNCKNCDAAYRREHHEEISLRHKARYHTEEYRRYSAAYYASHKEKFAAYYRSPRGRAASKAANHLRRARIKNNGGKLKASDIALIEKAHTDSKGRLRCARCGKVIRGAYHLDHWIPLDKGGTNDPGNFRVMHPRCNLSKSNKLPTEIGRLI